MCGLYSARKKLIHAMSLDIDRPITRAVVVGCAISATRNYLKLHMSRTLKVHSCATLMPKRGSCGSVLPGCRLTKQYSSINSAAPSVAALHAPAEMLTQFPSVPRYAEIHVASYSRRAHHRERRRRASLIALAAPSVPNFPRLRALALFGRRPVEPAEPPSCRRPKTIT